MKTDQRLGVAYVEALRVQRELRGARVHIAVGSSILEHLKSLCLTEDVRTATMVSLFGFPVVELEGRWEDIEVVATVAISP